MDCENCVHGMKMKPGTYKTVYGTLTVNGSSWKCELPVIHDLTFIGDEMRCSEFKERNRDINETD